MRRPSLSLATSMVLNALLSLWLVANYIYDIWFQQYVNSVVSQVNPLLLVGLVIAGLSGMGYIYMRNRGGSFAAGSSHRGRLPRQGGLSTTRSFPESDAKGPRPSSRPTLETKHTAYSVPALPKSLPPGGSGLGASRGTGPVTTLPGSSPLPPSSQRAPVQAVSETGPTHYPKVAGAPQQERPVLSRIEGSPQQSPNRAPSLPPQVDTRSSIPPRWGPGVPPPSGPAADRKPPSMGPHSAHREDSSLKGEQQIAEKSLVAIPPATPPYLSKWKSPEFGRQQWVDPVPKQPFQTPQKWSPPSPSGTTIPKPNFPAFQQRPAPMPQRQPFTQPRPAPRPLGQPGVLGPREYGQAQRGVLQPTIGTGQAGTSKVTVTTPNYNSPSVPAGASGISSGSQPARTAPPSPTPQAAGDQTTPSVPKKEAESTQGAGEMDWDTALDTILKTLRKDKVPEQQ